MGLFGRKSKSVDESSSVDGKVAKRAAKAPREARGSSGTYARSLATKAGTVALAFCVVSGPLALLGSFTPREQVVQAATAGVEGLTSEQQAAGEYALAFVTSWLAATREQPGDLGSYIDVRQVEKSLSEEAWAYRDAAIASVDVAEDAGSATVIVAANVRETKFDDDGEGVDVWPRRYFQVAVVLDGASLRAQTLPTPVAAPEQAEAPATRYNEILTTADPAGAAVVEFLTAYLTGTGDITRFISPDATIRPVQPALFVQLQPEEIRSDEAAEESPRDGDTLHVIATVNAANVDSRVLTTSYALTIVARAGRWEVASIDTAPQSEPESSTQTSPSPTTNPSTTPTPEPSSTGDSPS
jgi:hypothetical protein